MIIKGGTECLAQRKYHKPMYYTMLSELLDLFNRTKEVLIV